MSDEQVTRIRQWLSAGSINVFGRPFAGKDTVCQRLADDLNGVVLGGGDILRNSDIPAEVKAVMQRGELIPTDDYIAIVLPYLSKPEFDGQPLILSSVGRWIGEEEGVIGAAAQSNHPLKLTIHLDIAPEIASQRLAVATAETRTERSDDDPEILTRRLEEFSHKTVPVIEAYQRMGLLATVDGTLERDAVYQQVIEALLSRASASP